MQICKYTLWLRKSLNQGFQKLTVLLWDAAPSRCVLTLPSCKVRLNLGPLPLEKLHLCKQCHALASQGITLPTAIASVLQMIPKVLA